MCASPPLRFVVPDPPQRSYGGSRCNRRRGPPLLMERSHESGLSPSSPPQEFSLRSVSFAIVVSRRCRLGDSFAQYASASLHPAQRALRLRASESAMDERSSYNCALRKLRDLSQPNPRHWVHQPRQRPFAWLPSGLPGAFSHRACSGRTAND